MEKVNSDSSICLTLSSEGAALVPRPHFTDGNTEGQKDMEPKAHWLSPPRPTPGPRPHSTKTSRSVSSEGHPGAVCSPFQAQAS